MITYKSQPILEVSAFCFLSSLIRAWKRFGSADVKCSLEDEPNCFQADQTAEWGKTGRESYIIRKYFLYFEN